MAHWLTPYDQGSLWRIIIALSSFIEENFSNSLRETKHTRIIYFYQPVHVPKMSSSFQSWKLFFAKKKKKKKSDEILFTQLGYIFIKIYENYNIILMFFSRYLMTE